MEMQLRLHSFSLKNMFFAICIWPSTHFCLSCYLPYTISYRIEYCMCYIVAIPRTWICSCMGLLPVLWKQIKTFIYWYILSAQILGHMVTSASELSFHTFKCTSHKEDPTPCTMYIRYAWTLGDFCVCHKVRLLAM